jgi:acyl-CoA reductase-like NAD-dependent aldehyde dehydrogenase
MEIQKTYKLYINGSFPRTESGKYDAIYDKNGHHFANICAASRKDLREAVGSARKAFMSWSSRTDYNRAQILYRVAEILESRKESLITDHFRMGRTNEEAERWVSGAIALWVHFAGFADKWSQLLSTVNPVQGPFFNFSNPEPVGVVGVVSNTDEGILSLSRAILPVLVSGNSLILCAEGGLRHLAIDLAEVFAVSDVPAGVINILTTEEGRLDDHLFSHMDINALSLSGELKERNAYARTSATSNLKRVINPVSFAANKPGTVLRTIGMFTEIKTTWHPNLA